MSLKLVRVVAFALALLACAVALVLAGLERSGWLAGRAREELRRALGPDARVESVALDWFAPAIELRGLEFGDSDGSLRIESLRVAPRWSSGGVAIARIDSFGGRLRLSNALVARIESALAGSERTSAAIPGSAVAPTVVVEALEFSFLHPTAGELEIGRVDALSHAGEDGRARIEGRVTPSFSALRGPHSPHVFLAGQRYAGGGFEVVASCSGIPLEASALPPALRQPALEGLRPRGRLEFELSARFQLDAAAPAEGALRARIDDGVLEPPNSQRALSQISVDVDARCQTRRASELLDPATWRTTARADARWGAAALEAWALAGANAGEGLAARAWLRAPRLPLEEPFWRETGLFEWIERSWGALGLRGHADLLVGARWKSTDSFADTETAVRPEVALEVRAKGETGATYFGWPRASTGAREGFPAPVEQLTGRALALHSPDREHAALLALLEVLGAHSGGARTEQPAFIEGLIRFERPASDDASPRYPAFDLEIGTHGFPVDARLRAALLSLLPDDFVWRHYGPQGGHVSALVRLFRAPGADLPAAGILIDLFGVDAHWRPEAEAPDGAAPAELAVREIEGRVEILTDPRRAVGVRIDLAGASAQRAAVSVRGRVHDDTALPGDPTRWSARRVQELSVSARAVGLGGADRRTLARVWPQIAREVERREANGWADVDYRSATRVPGGPLTWRVEVTPRTAELSPEEFRVAVRNVRGRVIVSGAEAFGDEGADASPALVRIAPLLGDTLGGASVACNARIEVEGASRVEVLASAVAPSNPGIVGAFKHAFERTARGGQTGLSLSALAVDGRVDLSGTIVTSPLTPARPLSEFRVRLRENDVQTALPTGRFALDGLRGVLESRGDELRGERLNARLAGAPIELRNALFEEREGAATLETDFSASDFELDREHLAMFLDARTVDVLLGPRALRGAVDIRAAHLQLSTTPGRSGVVRLSGEISPRQLAVDLGLPVSVDAARVQVHELRYDSASVRALATLEGVNGTVASRRLANARLELEYSDPRLTIRDLQGELESGLLSRLDPRGERPAFQIDLREPFAFSLGVALERADVGALLAGVFGSDFATRGRVSLRMELDGDLNRMGGVNGRGRVELRDSNLWSVPVVRDLVSQFGLDGKNAVFDSIVSRFTVAAGQVRMSELDISSPYFGVSGAGTLDFDGSLRHDFEVRNSVVNLLGPFKNMLYRIAVRGDMARPRVETYGVLGQLFGESRSRTRALPLPDLSPLPPRF